MIVAEERDTVEPWLQRDRAGRDAVFRRRRRGVEPNARRRPEDRAVHYNSQASADWANRVIQRLSRRLRWASGPGRYSRGNA